MVNIESVKVKLSKTNETIIKVAAIVGAITVIAGGYSFYLNNLWKPKVEVLVVDFNQALAKIKLNNKTIDIFGDANFWIGGDWSIRLGNSKVNGQLIYDRIELLKKNMVVEYLKK